MIFLGFDKRAEPAEEARATGSRREFTRGAH